MHQSLLLDQVDTPEQLKALPAEQLPELCEQIREFLIGHVSRTGGHLASNLGAVELTVAIHRVFSAPQDDILFDVGHQCYVHKMLTGRKAQFETLRQFGGISGFLRPGESEYDSAVSGHASASVSAALGMARAKRLRGGKSATVCVIGDGALTGGMAYEALNDAGSSGLPLIIVFNDNDMSIGPSVGALAQRLSAIRIKPRYFRMKERTKQALGRLPGGEDVIRGVSCLKHRLRTMLLKETIFELMGFEYLGPADGNDVLETCSLLEQAKKLDRPVVIHLKTVKGKGYQPSEQAPEAFHGVSAFHVATGDPLHPGAAQCFSSAFGELLCRAAEQDPRVCAITAAMEAGTGLTEFARCFPGRFFDVGIAEEHAIGMAAGLAARGMRPVCAIYSTFLQRAYDQLIHDVAIGGLPVVLAVDRAGLVGADGETHQGLFDVPYLRTVPGLRLYAPANYAEQETALSLALAQESPAALRYPRGSQGSFVQDTMALAEALLRPGEDVTICTYGILTDAALTAAQTLEQEGIRAAVVKLNWLHGADYPLLREQAAESGRLIVLEDCVEQGCMGQKLAALLAEHKQHAALRLLNLKAQFVPQGTVEQLSAAYQIDDAAVAQAARELLHG